MDSNDAAAPAEHNSLASWRIDSDNGWYEAGDGLSAKPLYVSQREGLYAGFTRFSPGATIPQHRHDGDEVLVVVDGSIEDDGGRLEAGDASFRPPGCTHTVHSAAGGTVFVVVTGTSVPTESGGTGPVSRPERRGAVTEHGGSRRRLWPVDGPAGRVVSRIRLKPGKVLDLADDGSTRIVLVREGQVEHTGRMSGDGAFGLVQQGTAVSLLGITPAELLLFEWMDGSMPSIDSASGGPAA